MKALTIWQPWASLIMIGAKPFEFRGWPPPRYLCGMDMVIHAGTRAMKVDEIEDLLERLDDPAQAWTTGLFAEKARPLLQNARMQARYKPEKAKPTPVDLFALAAPVMSPTPSDLLPLGAGLGLVRVGEGVNGNDTAKTFGHVINDSDRDMHAQWGWRMLEVRPFAEPVQMRGAQGLWEWPDVARFAAAL